MPSRPFVPRVSRYLPVLAFVVLIFLPLVFVGKWELLGPGLSENRPTYIFPKKWSINYAQQVSDFFNDNLGFRNALVFLGSKVMFGLGVSSTHPSVIVGEGGWLFFTDVPSDSGRAFMKDFRGRHNFTADEIAAIHQNFENIGQAFSRCGMTFVLWLTPNKQTIYGEHLTGFREAKGAKRLDQLVEALREINGLQLVDARTALLAAKTSFKDYDLYLRTDTHWNGLGAFVAYRSLIADLMHGLTLTKLENADLANYEIRISPFSGGDLATTMLNAKWRFIDTKVDLLPRFARLASIVPKEEITASTGLPITATWSNWKNPEGVNSVVIYGDSFGIGAAPYIQEHFGRGHFIRDHVVDGEVVGRLRANVVIQQIVERYIGILISKPKNLDKLCGI